jgi:putative ABC transport system permease protein
LTLKNESNRPPKAFLRFLRWFCREDYLEEIEGDLTEVFEKQFEQFPRKAKWKFAWSVIKYFRPEFMKSFRNHQPNAYGMYKSYFTIGWRNLIRQKMYSSIKIGGFAVGIAACLLIALFIRQELSYDNHYANQDRIYRVLRHSSLNGEASVGIHLPAPFANVLQQDYPEIEKAGHYNAIENFGSGSNEVRRVDKSESFHEEGFIFVSQDMLDILEIPFVAGSPQHALLQPNTVVITRQKAEKYFPNEDPIGKVIILNNDEKRQYQVTGVIEEFPANSHLHSDFLMTLSDKEFWPGEQTSWRNQNYIDYVRVRPGTNIAALENKMSAILEKYILPYVLAIRNDKGEIDWIKSIRFELQPVKDIYLNEVGASDQLQHGDIRYIWLFGSIAAFILIIACINFINLSTARSASRAREVGLRKVVGSLRSSLIKQFLAESVLFSFCSFVVGSILAWAFLPYFNLLLAKSLAFPWKELWFLPTMGAAALLVGVVAGLYPAFYLSSFRPAQVLKGNVILGSNSTTRSVLVVFQFSVSVFLIISTVVVHRQMNYVLSKKLGYDKEQVLILEGTHTLDSKVITFKNELTRISHVKSASISGYLPVNGARRNGGGMWVEGMKEEDQVNSQHWAIDHDYVKTLGLNILKGRDFSIQIQSDSNAMVINESLAKALHLKEPIGSRLYNWLGGWTVIGVVEDFHSESMRESIKPMGLFIRSSPNTIAVKLSTTDMPGAIESVTKVWNKFSPDQPIRFTFLDQRYAQMYGDVERVGNVFTSFAILAIIVACLGLFALSAFMVEQRSKEISIRLVLGASLNSILNLLTFNFVKMVLVAIIIASPMAWYMMTNWLQDFSYKTEITWDIYALAGIISIAIALLTIGYQSFRAALMNPVDSLKSE